MLGMAVLVAKCLCVHLWHRHMLAIRHLGLRRVWQLRARTRVRNQRDLLQQHGHEYQHSGAGASTPLAERYKDHGPIPFWPTFTLRSLTITIVSA
jgi:hypothetical protein